MSWHGFVDLQKAYDSVQGQAFDSCDGIQCVWKLLIAMQSAGDAWAREREGVRESSQFQAS